MPARADANAQDPRWVAFREDYPNFTWADVVQYFGED